MASVCPSTAGGPCDICGVRPMPAFRGSLRGPKDLKLNEPLRDASFSGPFSGTAPVLVGFERLNDMNDMDDLGLT